MTIEQTIFSFKVFFCFKGIYLGKKHKLNPLSVLRITRPEGLKEIG